MLCGKFIMYYIFTVFCMKGYWQCTVILMTYTIIDISAQVAFMYNFILQKCFKL